MPEEEGPGTGQAPAEKVRAPAEETGHRAQTWHYASGGRVHGPVETRELERLARTGALRRSDDVSSDGTSTWMKASEVPGLFAQAGKAAGAPEAWRRAAAYGIDAVSVFGTAYILYPFVVTAVITVLVGILWLFAAVIPGSPPDISFLGALAHPLVSHVLGWGGYLFYFSYLESSEWQATIGKQVMNIVVTDQDGRRLRFNRAAARTVAGLFSVASVIGAAICAFTERREALHDIVTGTVVRRGRIDS